MLFCLTLFFWFNKLDVCHLMITLPARLLFTLTQPLTTGRKIFDLMIFCNLVVALSITCVYVYIFVISGFLLRFLGSIGV